MRRAVLIGCAAAGALASAAGVKAWRSGARLPAPPAASASPAPADQPAFVGSAACAGCHPREAAVWTGSHHQAAMQRASPGTVLGGKLSARAVGPDGAPHTYEIAYTFGVWPLQQDLVAFPGGRLQALPTAWDARPRAAGGQRWFDLHAGETIAPGDSLHWTAAGGNWNQMCADCHSTNVRKGWDDRSGTYATTFSEISIGCEACHGPGSRHVAAAGRAPLPVALDERRGVSWTHDPVSGQPRRSAPRTSSRELDTCARCHARRGQLREETAHGQPIGDDYRVALLDEDLYWPDGQVRGEVYEYGSFLQSRMAAEGVTCGDCHDAHRPELRALASPQNVCLQCHRAQAYLTPKHHFHRADSAGASCVACHMPAATFMVVDDRHDHSLRVPRPDLSVQLGVPNPCTARCHADRPAVWAARTVERWYGHTPSGRQRFAVALAGSATGAPRTETETEAASASALAQLAGDRTQPGIARATAVARLGGRLSAAALSAVAEALNDADDLVRRAAVSALARAEPEARVALAGPRLADPVRAVRLEAASVLAAVPAEALSPQDLDARRRATDELVAAEELNADRPESHLNLALLRADQGDPRQAEAQLRRALELDPTFGPAAANLADLYRAQGRDVEGERVLRQALDRSPEDPSLCHALGLALVRQRRLDEALPWLGRAAARAGSDPRYGYVYAVALHDAGRRTESLRELESVLRRRPGDRPTLDALASFSSETGPSQAPSTRH